jgi:hypothetical protein
MDWIKLVDDWNNGWSNVQMAMFSKKNREFLDRLSNYQFLNSLLNGSI